jgi:hypothetical protein
MNQAGFFHLLRNLVLPLGLMTCGMPLWASGTNNLTLPGLIYHPEKDAIVMENGSRWYNRPLYCNARATVIFGGEMPGLGGQLGTLQAAVSDGATILGFHEFANRVMRYRPGRLEWDLSDPKFPGLNLVMTATTVSEGDGFAVEIRASGARPGQELLWRYFPPDGGKGYPVPLMQLDTGFKSGLIEGVLGEKTSRCIQASIASRKGGGILSRGRMPTLGGDGLEMAVPLENSGGVHFMAITGEGVVKPVDARKVFEKGMERVVAMEERVKARTPDPWFDAGVGASVPAMYGLFVAPFFVHGGSDWRSPYLGWRVMDGATAYGWHDLVAIDMEGRSKTQVKVPNGKTNAESVPAGTEQSQNSRFYGLGKVNATGGRYDMQTQFFDQCVRDWRHTGDKEFAEKLLPMLELHLQWAKECFDPGDRGIFESYINSWPTDNQWYNGGGTTEESAYIYNQQKAAADMCRQLGKTEDGKKHEIEAEKIRQAVDRVLWLPGKGLYGAYVEQGGRQRVHDDPWVYSEHLPIEAGMATPIQAWQAMDYTDREMEHYKFPYGGEMRQTSNWVPGTWSLRELFGGDNYAMALGYFLAGQGDEGWELLKGTMLESMYGDPVVKQGYSHSRAQLIAPGGLSQPNCSIDFNDVTSMFCRTVAEGLFGYRPDYPNGVVVVAPTFPSAWDHASFQTPDYSLSFLRKGDEDLYTIGLKRPAKIRLRLPVRAENIVSVTADGKPLSWRIEPWPGCGMLEAELPETTKAEVSVNLKNRSGQISSKTIIKKARETVEIKDAIDPQGCLGPKSIPGHRLAFARVERGNVPYLQVYKVEVTDPEGDVERAEKNLTNAPQGAIWSPVGMSNLFNGDIREIFRQKYISPRPNTVSCRLAYNGITPWIGVLAGNSTNSTKGFDWDKITPVVQLDKEGSLLKNGRLTTPQGAEFDPIQTGAPPVKNIAFTSLWDNWPRKVTVPIAKSGEAVWLLVCGTTNPMQGRIANAVITFRYSDGKEEHLDLIPPFNFWSMLPFGADYDYTKDRFALPKNPPPQVQLGKNCRAMVYGWRLRPGVSLQEVTLETLSQEDIIGLMGVSVMNSK